MKGHAILFVDKSGTMSNEAMISSTNLDGKEIWVDDRFFRIFLHPAEEQGETSIGWLETRFAEYVANISSISENGIHWFMYFLGTRCSGTIPTKHLKLV